MSLPRVQPIIPTRRKEPFDDPRWLFDCKYDGFRGVCYVQLGRGSFVSRNGNHLARFDKLGDQLAAVLELGEAILDGEIIAADATGRPQFYDLLRGTRVPWQPGREPRYIAQSASRRCLKSNGAPSNADWAATLTGRTRGWCR